MAVKHKGGLQNSAVTLKCLLRKLLERVFADLGDNLFIKLFTK